MLLDAETGDDGARGQGPAPGTSARGRCPPGPPGFFGRGEVGGNLAQMTGRGGVRLIASNAANRQYGKAAIQQTGNEAGVSRITQAESPVCRVMSLS